MPSSADHDGVAGHRTASSVFFDSWNGLLRVLVVGTCGYAALVGILRVSGKRTLSKMNAFDFVVTVALGSTLASIVVSKDVALAEGVLALILLVALQYAVAWISVRSSAVRSVVKSEPTLLAHRGEFLSTAMRRERVTEGEVLSALRAQGLGSLADAESVVLETQGDISVIPRRSA